MHAPVTALYAGLLGLLMLVLSFRVVAVRRATSIGLGDGGDALLLSRIRIQDRKSTRLNSSHIQKSRMPSSA